MNEVSGAMQVSLCRLRTHQCCFILFNVALFHALLFGADFLEEYFLRSAPVSYTDGKFLELREEARRLNLSVQRENISASYVISGSERCASRDLFLLLVVFSSPENRIRRDRIRQTWANATRLRGLEVTRVFMLGRAGSAHSDLLNESRLHQDLVQGGFPEASPNDARTAAMMLQWIVAFCPGARFILKADEQTLVNVESLSRYLQSPGPGYTGRVLHRVRPDRDPRSPGFVPVTSYPEAVYPDYCSGAALVLSQEVARRMYLVSGAVPLAVPAEVFLGLSARRAGVLPAHSWRFSGAQHVPYNRCCYRLMFSSSGVADDAMSEVWAELGRGCSTLQTYYGLVSCKLRAYVGRYYNSQQDA